MATRVIPTERQIEQVHARYHLALVGLALIAAGLTMLVLFMIIGPMFATWLIKANISMLYSGVVTVQGVRSKAGAGKPARAAVRAWVRNDQTLRFC